MAIMMNPEIRRVLVGEAMLGNPPRTVHLTYTNREGATIERHVEPYKIEGTTLFGWCLADQHIKRFDVLKITAILLGDPFKPRHEIQVPL